MAIIYDKHLFNKHNILVNKKAHNKNTMNLVDYPYIKQPDKLANEACTIAA